METCQNNNLITCQSINQYPIIINILLLLLLFLAPPEGLRAPEVPGKGIYNRLALGMHLETTYRIIALPFQTLIRFKLIEFYQRFYQSTVAVLTKALV